MASNERGSFHASNQSSSLFTSINVNTDLLANYKELMQIAIEIF